MSKTRNVRARQLRRWEMRCIEHGRRNGVTRDGYDPRGVTQAVPWCVLAYLDSHPRWKPRMSTRRYKADDILSRRQHRRTTP